VCIYRDHVMRLRVSDLELLELARWTADNLTVSMCLAKGQLPVSVLHRRRRRRGRMGPDPHIFDLQGSIMCWTLNTQ